MPSHPITGGMGHGSGTLGSSLSRSTAHLLFASPVNFHSLAQLESVQKKANQNESYSAPTSAKVLSMSLANRRSTCRKQRQSHKITRRNGFIELQHEKTVPGDSVEGLPKQPSESSLNKNSWYLCELWKGNKKAPLMRS